MIASLHLCGNTGTYVDAPIHRHREGADLAALPLKRLADLETVVVDCTGAERTIGADSLSAVESALPGAPDQDRLLSSLGDRRVFQRQPISHR